MHDLNAVLLATRKLLPYAPKDIRISWFPAGAFSDFCWGMWHYHADDGHWIGIHDSAKKAPRYVVEYLVGHEVLHATFPPRRGAKRLHSKAFLVADALLPGAAKAKMWLDRA